jgi:hypothetical protein
VVLTVVVNAGEARCSGFDGEVVPVVLEVFQGAGDVQIDDTRSMAR